jgi:hypothetical protein
MEVQDVVLADNMWTNESYSTSQSSNLTTIALHVEVMNKGSGIVDSWGISFDFRTDEGDRYRINHYDIVDPRIHGGPFYQRKVSINPGQTHGGWVGVSVMDSSLTWTEGVLRIPTREGGPDPPTASFTLEGATRLGGLTPRLGMTVERVTYTNTIGGQEPFGGRAFLIIDLTFENLGWSPYTVNPMDLILWYGRAGGFFAWPTPGDWDIPDALGVVDLEPRGVRTLSAVFDKGSPQSIESISFIERTRDFRPVYLNITIPLDAGMVEGNFDPPRVELDIERVWVTDEVGGRLPAEGNVFHLVRTKMTASAHDNIDVMYGNITLVDGEGSEHSVSSVTEHLQDPIEEGQLKAMMPLNGDLAFEVPEGTGPAWLGYRDYGQTCTGMVDASTVVDTRDWPMLDIQVVNLTWTEWLDDRYYVDEGEMILLVMINVSHRWDETQHFELGNITLFDANGTQVLDEVMNMWSPDHLRGSASLSMGEWEDGQFHLRVGQDFEPGKLVYSDPGGDIEVDISGMDITHA